MRNRSEAEETKQLDQWVNIAKELNKAEGYNYWGQAETVTAVFRYLRLKPEQAINNTGQFRILESFEGIRVKVNQKYFEAQRSVLKGTLTLK